MATRRFQLSLAEVFGLITLVAAFFGCRDTPHAVGGLGVPWNRLLRGNDHHLGGMYILD
jgi:hypothetical protein